MIETNRLLLRQHELPDFPAYHRINNDPRVMQFLGSGALLGDEESWNRFIRNAGFHAVLGYGLFAIIERSSGEYVGLTGLASFHRGLGADFDPFPEAAWSLAGDMHGRGYAIEAANAAHDWFSGKFGPQRTVCIIDANNIASLKLAEKLGYRAYDEAVYKEKRVIKLERGAHD